MIKKAAPYSDELAERHKEVVIDAADGGAFLGEIQKVLNDGLRLAAMGNCGLPKGKMRMHFLPNECFDEEVAN